MASDKSNKGASGKANTNKASEAITDPRQTSVPGSGPVAPESPKVPKLDQQGIDVDKMSKDALLSEIDGLQTKAIDVERRRALCEQEIADRLIKTGNKGASVKMLDGTVRRARSYEAGPMAGKRILVDVTEPKAVDIE